MMDYRQIFAKSIYREYPDYATSIIAETGRQFRRISPDIKFAATSKNPMDRRLEICAYFLALIITLDERGASYEEIRKICLDIVIEYVRPKNKLQSALKKLPTKLISTWLGKQFAMIFNKKVSQNENPEGFIARIITDKEQTFGLGFGFDIIECGICKLFGKYNYQKYVPILCEVDKLTSGMAGLTLVRNSTIAFGAKTCDFRFKKLS
jgi:hypothetical protein